MIATFLSVLLIIPPQGLIIVMTKFRSEVPIAVHSNKRANFSFGIMSHGALLKNTVPYSIILVEERFMSQPVLTKSSDNSEINCSTTVSARGDKRRAQLILSAEQTFLKNGYRETTMEDIASHARASKSTFYKFFGNKEALFAEIVRSRVPNLGDLTAELIQHDQDVRTTLYNWGMEILKLITTPTTIALYRVLLAEMPWNPKLGNIHYNAGPKTSHKILGDYFRKATLRGDLHCTDVDLAARLFTSMIGGDPFDHALFGLSNKDWGATELHVHVTEAVEVFMARYG
jgi:AcrR family transcriptional regulator